MNAVIDLLTQWTMAATFACALVLLVRGPVTRWVGARWAYACWLTVPASLAAFVLAFTTPLATSAVLPDVNVAGWETPVAAAGAGEAGWLAPLVLSAWSMGVAVGWTLLWQQACAARRLVCGSRPASSCWHPESLDDRATLRVSADVSGPLVAGVLRPVILLPKDFDRRLGPEARRLVLRHEFRHVRRRDNAANLLAAALAWLLWFNPIAWLALRAFREDQETSCDAGVLERSSDAPRLIYAKCMLSMATHGQPSAITCSWHHRKLLERRIRMIEHHRASRFRNAIGALTVAGVVAIASGAALGSGTVPGDATETEPRTPVAGPTPIVRIAPSYPAAAAENEIEGFVTAEFTITEDGRVTDVVIIESSPANMFDRAAIDALEKWRFAPQTMGAEPARVRATQTIEFQLD